MLKICQIYANDTQKYAKEMPKICQRTNKDMPKMPQSYAKDMPKICQRQLPKVVF